jgi:pimeloyl-ACP methyl ester carboxylesterase
MTPHRFGQIPVVFVHGTASSAGRWAEMINVLQGDPAIRDRYDFWAFSYDSGNPIVYSSMILRDALTNAVKLLDPEGKDPGLQQMVVIGHSQGGLLTKMMVVNTGTQLYDAVFKKPLDQLKISDETRDFVRRTLFVTALPFVKRVIFISTPQRGSYQAASELVRTLVQRLVSTPARLVKGTAELLANREALAVTQGGKPLAHRGGQHVAAQPVHQDALDHPHRPRGGGPLDHPRQGHRARRDGRRRRREVRERAHRRREVELVVRWEHSVQGQPEAILEVRRILLEHATAR